MLPRLIRCHHPPSAVVHLLFCLSFHSSKHQPGAFPQCCCKATICFIYWLNSLEQKAEEERDDVAVDCSDPRVLTGCICKKSHYFPSGASSHPAPTSTTFPIPTDVPWAQPLVLFQALRFAVHPAQGFSIGIHPFAHQRKQPSACGHRNMPAHIPRDIYLGLTLNKPRGCALKSAEDMSHITQCVPSNIFRSSGSPWIFLSRTTREWQLAMAPHTGPHGRGLLDGNLWIFWKLIRSRELEGLLARGVKRSPQLVCTYAALLHSVVLSPVTSSNALSYSSALRWPRSLPKLLSI